MERKKKKKQIQIQTQIHTPTKRERRSKSGFGFRSCCSSPRSESGFLGFSCGMLRTRPVDSVSTNEGLKGTNLRRIDTTSWVSKIDLVLQIEINLFFRLRNIVLEIYSCDLFLTLILWAMKGQYLSPFLFQLTEYKPNL